MRDVLAQLKRSVHQPRLELRRSWCQSGLFRLQRALQREVCSRRLSGPVQRSEGAEPTVTLARIIGNDLYPRHAEGQALINLQTVLDQEPNRPGWRKLFVFNRCLDASLVAEAVRQVEALVARLRAPAGPHRLCIPIDAPRVEESNPGVSGDGRIHVKHLQLLFFYIIL